MHDPPASPKTGSLVSPLALLEHVPVTAYLLRAEGDDFVLEGVNAAARAKTPALQAVIGKRISILYADQPQMIADAQRCHRERTQVVRETTVRRHERLGGVRQSLVFASLDDERIVIYAHDLSDAVNLHVELAELQERYRSLLDSLPVAMLLRGADGRVLACNDAAALLFGHKTASDLWGKHDILAPGYELQTGEGVPVEHAHGPTQRALRGERLQGDLYRLIDAAGGVRFLSVSAQPVRNADGSAGGAISLFADETERVAARLAEREAALQLQLALDAAKMGTWQYEPQTDHGYWSPALDVVFALPPDRNGVEDYLRYVHPDDRQNTMAFLAALIAKPDGATFEHEHRLVGTDNLARWARMRGRVERSDQRMRLIGTAMDVTERRQMQEELLRQSRLESLGRLAGGVAHDFNNLLAAMLGSIELLGDVCPPEGQEDLGTLRHVAVRARELTTQLLAFARRQRVELAPLDARALLGKIERLLERLVGPTVRLIIDAGGAGDTALHVRADAAQLEQVLINLVINARDAMPDGGTVVVRLNRETDASAERDWVTFEVLDQGGGISGEHLPHIFDPFFTTKESGTGLGLASSYGVVEAHGGRLSVESEPGRGSTFKVRLPRVTPDVRSNAAARRAASGVGRVLLVDDDDAVRLTTLRMLRSLGYDVLVAADGAQAERLAREPGGKLDVLLCDLAMPLKSGPEVAIDIKRLHPDIKVLFVSGYPRGTEHDFPVESFLQKPYDREALARKLSALISANPAQLE